METDDMRGRLQAASKELLREAEKGDCTEPMVLVHRSWLRNLSTGARGLAAELWDVEDEAPRAKVSLVGNRVVIDLDPSLREEIVAARSECREPVSTSIRRVVEGLANPVPIIDEADVQDRLEEMGQVLENLRRDLGL